MLQIKPLNVTLYEDMIHSPAVSYTHLELMINENKIREACSSDRERGFKMLMNSLDVYKRQDMTPSSLRLFKKRKRSFVSIR